MMETQNTIPKGLPLNPEYMIFYSPGKVGSTTVMEAMRTIGVPLHRCGDNNIEHYHRKDYPVITAVRDPISWAFSFLFERALSNNLVIIPEHAQAYVDHIVAQAENGFVKDYCDWFTKHRQVTGTNVYTNRWLKKQGWMIMSMRSLVVRTDMMDTVLEPALRAFVPTYYPDKDLSGLLVEHRAKGADRFLDYEQFMANVVFDRQWIGDFYDKTPYCRKFFFAAEMKKWIKKWAKLR